MKTETKNIRDFFPTIDPNFSDWELKAFRSHDCLSYIAWNKRTKEAIAIDLKDTDIEAYLSQIRIMPDYIWLGVLDTHTHADHISAAPLVSNKISAPYMMLSGNSNTRVSVRITQDTVFSTHAGSLTLLKTPGHTQDSITITWGPFIFGGDTVLIGDSGRDDLPGGNVENHFESLQKLKVILKPEMILLPGHDPKGIRASLWKDQLLENSSLIQNREDFIKESNSFKAPTPQFLNESLRENLK